MMFLLHFDDIGPLCERVSLIGFNLTWGKAGRERSFLGTGYSSKEAIMTNEEKLALEKAESQF